MSAGRRRRGTPRTRVQRRRRHISIHGDDELPPRGRGLETMSIYAKDFCELLEDAMADESSAKPMYSQLFTLCTTEMEGIISRSTCRQLTKIRADEQKHGDVLRQIHIRYCRLRGP